MRVPLSIKVALTPMSFIVRLLFGQSMMEMEMDNVMRAAKILVTLAIDLLSANTLKILNLFTPMRDNVVIPLSVSTIGSPLPFKNTHSIAIFTPVSRSPIISAFVHTLEGSSSPYAYLFSVSRTEEATSWRVILLHESKNWKDSNGM